MSALWSPLIRTPIPSRGPHPRTSSKPNYPPKTPLPNPLGIRASSYDFGEDTFSPQNGLVQNLCKKKPKNKNKKTLISLRVKLQLRGSPNPKIFKGRGDCVHLVSFLQF